MSTKVGYGVFATREIARGTIVWALDPFDLRLGDSTLDELPELLREAVQRWSYRSSDGLVFCWDHARYVNHSCRPNCLEFGFSFEVAARTIAVGEELTCDYDVIGTLFEFECRCAEATCRVRISGQGSSPAPLSAELLGLIERVPQPLLDFAAPEAPDRPLLQSMRCAQ